MAKMADCIRLIAIPVLVLSLILSVSVNVMADPGVYDQGSFDIFTLDDGNWQWQGKIDFNNYDTRELALEHDAGLVKLRIVQQGHDAAYVDYVALCQEGATYRPISAANVDGNVDILAKVIAPEYDVCDAWGSTLELAWDSVPASTTLIMRAMEEDLGTDHGGPLYYPYIHLGETLRHTLVNDGGITADGLLAESTEPDFSVFWTPTSPHPAGYTYGWLHCDEDYLYAAVEVTADNTADEEDWGALYVTVSGDLKEFRVSPHDSSWGAIGFQYAPSVPYEHRIYEFRIPLTGIGARIGDELQYGFGCYGTVAETIAINIATSPPNTGTVAVDGNTYGHGEFFVASAGPEPHHIVAHPGGGYVFVEWKTEGGIGVPNPELADTTCFFDGDGTLIMIQEPGLPGGSPSVPGISLWGGVALAVLFSGTLIWLVRRRLTTEGRVR